MKGAPHTFITMHGTIDCWSYTKENIPGHDYEIVTFFDQVGRKIFKKMYTCKILAVFTNKV